MISSMAKLLHAQLLTQQSRIFAAALFTRGVSSIDAPSSSQTVQVADPKPTLTLRVDNFPPSADLDTIRRLFQPYGPVYGVRYKEFAKRGGGQVVPANKEIMFVDLSPEVGEAAQKLNGTEIEGQKIRVWLQKGAERPNPHLYITNLPAAMEMSELRGLLEPFGAIETSKYLQYTDKETRQKMQRKETAFVRFEGEGLEVAKAAQAALDNHEVQGQKITVSLFARKKYAPKA